MDFDLILLSPLTLPVLPRILVTAQCSPQDIGYCSVFSPGYWLLLSVLPRILVTAQCSPQDIGYCSVFSPGYWLLLCSPQIIGYSAEFTPGYWLLCYVLPRVFVRDKSICLQFLRLHTRLLLNPQGRTVLESFKPTKPYFQA